MDVATISFCQPIAWKKWWGAVSYIACQRRKALDFEILGYMN